jgi:hypothetical protein
LLRALQQKDEGCGVGKMKRQRLYHTTRAERADAIMRDGFRDNAPKLVCPVITYTPRVWFAPVPAISHVWFDAGMMWPNDIYETQTFITIDVPLPLPRGICSSEDPDQIVEVANDGDVVAGIVRSDIGWPCVQYWGPAEIWNKFPRKRLELDDVIRLRLAAEPALVRKIEQKLMMANDYLDDFQVLLGKILIENFQVHYFLRHRFLQPAQAAVQTTTATAMPKPQFRQPPRFPGGKKGKKGRRLGPPAKPTLHNMNNEFCHPDDLLADARYHCSGIEIKRFK